MPCACGCGQDTLPYKQTILSRGMRKGEPARFCLGHRSIPTQPQDPWPRFWSRVEKTPTCWLWTGACDTGGYGQRSVNGKQVLVHRWLFETLIGPIPRGYVPDHVCRVRRCVNLDDMIIKTSRDNTLSGDTIPARYAARTHCSRGHPFSGHNLMLRKDGTGRRCRLCNLMHTRVSLERKYGRPVGTRTARVDVTHCPHGHLWTVDNTYLPPRGYRECRKCRADRRQRDQQK
jgi:hypothetical protein